MRDWIHYWATRTPEAIAIIDGVTAEAYSYKAIDATATAIAHQFAKRGLRKGDRLALLMPTCIDNIYYFAAAVKLGLILVPLNYRLTSEELAPLIASISPSLMITCKQFSALLPETQEYQLSSDLLRSTVRRESDAANISTALSDDDPIFILYTSGSSGTPKGVIYTHGMLFWNSVNTTISLSLGTSTCTVSCMPPFHTGGWNVLVTPLLHAGGSSVLLPKFEPEIILSCLEQYQASVFMGVPTMLRMLSECNQFSSTALPHLKYMIVGGEAMPLDLIELYHSRNIMIRQGYGMTEVGPNLTSLHHNDAVSKKGSIGKTNMYVNYRIVDNEKNDVTAGQQGELIFSGPIVTPGYWNDKASTKQTIQKGWLHTGDIVIQDADGDLYIVDRIKNMYISGGENVYPAEVEKLLSEHPMIKEIVIVGISDQKWGEVGLAYVVSDEKVDFTAIDEHAKKRIASYKTPKYYLQIDKIPTTANGKIDRKQLKARGVELYSS